MAFTIGALAMQNLRGIGIVGILTNDKNLSLALDRIPAIGAVSREANLPYIDRFQRAFLKDDVVIAPAKWKQKSYPSSTHQRKALAIAVRNNNNDQRCSSRAA